MSSTVYFGSNKLALARSYLRRYVTRAVCFRFFLGFIICQLRKRNFYLHISALNHYVAVGIGSRHCRSRSVKRNYIYVVALFKILYRFYGGYFFLSAFFYQLVHSGYFSFKLRSFFVKLVLSGFFPSRFVDFFYYSVGFFFSLLIYHSGFGSCVGKYLFFLFVYFCPLSFDFVFKPLGFFTILFRSFLLVYNGFLAYFKVCYHVLKLDVFTANKFFSAVYYKIRQSEFFRYGKGVALTRYSYKQFVGRSESLDIKFTTCVFYSVC